MEVSEWITNSQNESHLVHYSQVNSGYPVMDIVPELAEKFGMYQSTHKLNNHMNKLQHLVEISLLIQKQFIGTWSVAMYMFPYQQASRTVMSCLWLEQKRTRTNGQLNVCCTSPLPLPSLTLSLTALPPDQWLDQQSSLNGQGVQDGDTLLLRYSTWATPFNAVRAYCNTCVCNQCIFCRNRKKFFILNDDVQEALEDNTLLFVLLYHQVGC